MTVLRDVYCVLQGPDRRAVQLMLCIAIINQGMASNSIINYAPQLLQTTHTANSHAVLWTSFITIAKVQATTILSTFVAGPVSFCLTASASGLQELHIIKAACHSRVWVCIQCSCREPFCRCPSPASASRP